jgi:hypothetical protein
MAIFSSGVGSPVIWQIFSSLLLNHAAARPPHPAKPKAARPATASFFGLFQCVKEKRSCILACQTQLRETIYFKLNEGRRFFGHYLKPDCAEITVNLCLIFVLRVHKGDF